MSMFKATNEPDAKVSMTRVVVFAFTALAYVAVIMKRDAATVASIVGGGAIAALAMVWKDSQFTKDGSSSK